MTHKVMVQIGGYISVLWDLHSSFCGLGDYVADANERQKVLRSKVIRSQGQG